MKPKFDNQRIKKTKENNDLEKRITIKDWSEEDRPREKLIMKGAGALSDTELVAILLRTGTSNYSAIDIARHLMKKVDNNLEKLSKLSPRELIGIKGVGLSKAVTLIAAFELGKRINTFPVMEEKKITCSYDVYQYFQSILTGLNHEEFWIIALNNSNFIIDKFKISQGGLSKTIIDVRIIFKKVLESLATSIILCHNHPSGNTMPSDADIQITNKIIEASKLFDIKVLDHIVFSDKKYFSFADEGLL